MKGSESVGNLNLIEQRELLGKEFKIYGDYENPLFLAKDVAEWIEHSNPTEMIKSVDDDEKLNSTILSSGQNRTVTFLTEDGLYEVLMQSRKPIAKEFKKEVKKILKTIRKTGSYKVSNLEEMKIKASQDRAKAMLLNAQNRTLKTIMKAVDNKNLSSIAIEVFGLKAIEKATGVDMGSYLPQVEKTYTATEIGNILGVSANKIGSLATEHKLKTSDYGIWVMDKAKYSNKDVHSFRYFEKSIDKFRSLVNC